MGLIRRALKSPSYIHLGGGTGWTVPPSRSIIYQSPWDDASHTVSGRVVDDKTALSYPPFFAGVRLIAETVVRMPLILYRRNGESRERASDVSMYNMLRLSPNPDMTAMTFKESLQGHVITRGNGYAEKVRDGLGRVVEMWPLRPDRMSVLYDTD